MHTQTALPAAPQTFPFLADSSECDFGQLVPYGHRRLLCVLRALGAGALSGAPRAPFGQSRSSWAALATPQNWDTTQSHILGGFPAAGGSAAGCVYLCEIIYITELRPSKHRPQKRHTQRGQTTYTFTLARAHTATPCRCMRCGQPTSGPMVVAVGGATTGAGGGLENWFATMEKKPSRRWCGTTTRGPPWPRWSVAVRARVRDRVKVRISRARIS